MSTNPLFKVVGNKWQSRKELHTLSTKLSGFGFKDRGSFWPDSWQQNHWKHVMHTLHNYTVQPSHQASCHTPEHIHSSGISWTICKQSEPHSRQITTATPHHSIFYRSDALPAAQPTHTHTHPFNGPLSGTTRVSWYQKVKPIWILLKEERVSAAQPIGFKNGKETTGYWTCVIYFP